MELVFVTLTKIIHYIHQKSLLWKFCCHPLYLQMNYMANWKQKKCWYLYLIEDNLHPLKSIIVNFKFLCIQTKKYFYNCTSIICVVWFQVFLKQTCIHTFCSQSLPLLSFPFYDKPPKKMLLKQSNCLSILYYN